jgi:hypothetical protein
VAVPTRSVPNAEQKGRYIALASQLLRGGAAALYIARLSCVPSQKPAAYVESRGWRQLRPIACISIMMALLTTVKATLSL